MQRPQFFPTTLFSEHNPPLHPLYLCSTLIMFLVFYRATIPPPPVLPPYSVYPRCAATLLRSCPHPSFLSKRPCRLASVKRKTGAPISDERASALVFYTAHVTRKPQSSPQSLIRTNSYRKLYTYSSSHPISSAAATANSISGCIVVRSKTLLPRLLRYCQTNRPDCGTTTGGNENRQTFSIHTYTHTHTPKHLSRPDQDTGWYQTP